MNKVTIEDITTEREDLRNLIGGTGFIANLGVEQSLVLVDIEKDGATHPGISTSAIRTIQRVGKFTYVLTRNSTYKLREAT